MSVIDDLKEAVIEGQISRATQLTREAVANGVLPDTLFSESLAPAMEEVGRRMQRNEYYIPEVLVSAKTMKASAEILKPLIVQSGKGRSRGKVVLGTVKGDLHDIGKNLVAMMLEGAGFDVIDLGNDVPAEKFVELVREVKPQVLGMSALLTTTMLQMGKVVQALESAGLRSRVRVMVGGAPVTQSFANEIGADGYGVDSANAVELAKAWTAAG